MLSQKITVKLKLTLNLKLLLRKKISSLRTTSKHAVKEKDDKKTKRNFPITAGGI
jgi:hypothetical protein